MLIPLFQAIVAGRLADYGFIRLPVFISTILFVATQFLIAEATEFWQLMLGQGVMLGVSTGLLIILVAPD